MPEEKPPVSIGRCKWCNDDICVGEEYAEIEDSKYHIDCLDDMNTYELLSLFGVSYKVAEEEILV